MRERVISVMAAVFNQPVEEVSESMSLGRTPSWDSLRHMTLVLALEDEFQMTFEVEQIMAMTNISCILQALKERGCG